jgi:hypothetical protein
MLVGNFFLSPDDVTLPSKITSGVTTQKSLQDASDYTKMMQTYRFKQIAATHI